MKIFRTIALGCFLFIPVLVRATSQVQDAIEYEGHTYRIGRWMDALPLEDYFREKHIRPKEFKAYSSHCWRGYLAFWRVVSNKLWLTQIFIIDEDGEYTSVESVPEKNFPLQRLFPNEGPAVHASWFTGKIELGRSLVKVEKVKGGQRETYEGRILVVEKGNITKCETGSFVALRADQPDPRASRDSLGPPPLQPQKAAPKK